MNAKINALCSRLDGSPDLSRLDRRHVSCTLIGRARRRYPLSEFIRQHYDRP